MAEKTWMSHEERRVRRGRILARARSGEMLDAIAADENLAYGTVDMMTRGVKRNLPGAMKSSYAVIAVLMNTNLGFQEIADARGVSKQSVKQIHAKCIKHGIPVRSRGRQKIKRVA